MSENKIRTVELFLCNSNPTGRTLRASFEIEFIHVVPNMKNEKADSGRRRVQAMPDGGWHPAENHKNRLGVRTWLLIDEHGGAEMIESDRRAIMRRTGIPARDLRILDPVLSQPPRIFGRERAIVVNLEYIKAIITTREVLLLNSNDPAFAPLVTDFQRRLHERQVPGLGECSLDDFYGESDERCGFNYSPGSNLRKKFSIPFSPTLSGLYKTPLRSNISENKTCPKAPPFEFQALETCLEAVCSYLDSETTSLEKEAYPALDELSSNVSTLNLERVRQIKNHLVAISARVEKVRDEIEQLLDDDGDMAEMYLTNKLLEQQPCSYPDGSNTFSTHLTSDQVEYDRDGERSLVGGITVLSHIKQTDSLRIPEKVGQDESIVLSSSDMAGGYPDSSSSSTGNSIITKPLNVEELEMLLEAYFVQIDGILNKISTVIQVSLKPVKNI
eukprot:c23225_g1_i1 orf=230-1561(+)